MLSPSSGQKALRRPFHRPGRFASAIHYHYNDSGFSQCGEWSFNVTKLFSQSQHDCGFDVSSIFFPGYFRVCPEILD